MRLPTDPGALFDGYSEHPDPCLLVSREGLILAVNPAYEREFGSADNSALIGIPFADFTHNTSSGSDEVTLAQSTEVAELLEYVNAGGIRRFLGAIAERNTLREFTLSSLRNATDVVGILVTLRPTGIRAGRERHERDDWVESVGALAVGIVHDLNNALTPIMLSAQLLLRTAQNEKNLRLLKSIEASAIHGANLIKHVQQFAPDAESTDYLLDAGELVRSTVDTVRESCPTKFSIEAVLEDRPLLVVADTTQLQRVLLNLIVNAQDSMPEGGKIVIRAFREPTTGAKGHSSMVIIEVHDSGVGIADNHVGRIFDPFFSTKAVGAGTGLGLPTSQRIVTNAGGTLTVSNNIAGGATFRITLPRSPGE